MKKILLIFGWLGISVSSLVYCLFLLHAYTQVKYGNTLMAVQARQMFPKNGYQFYASLPQVLGSFTIAVAMDDARPEILRQFLHSHNSQLEAFAGKIVSVSDAQGIDYRLIPAIAMCESNLGKHMPAGSYNAWGYAIYTGEDSGAVFNNWDHAIETMGSYLASYYHQGKTTPEAIGPIYAPPSVETGNSWAKCVRLYMDELQ